MSSHEPTQQSIDADNMYAHYLDTDNLLEKIAARKYIPRIIVHTGNVPNSDIVAHWETDAEYKYRNFKYCGEMIDIYRWRPDTNSVVKCLVEVYIHGELGRTEERVAKYLGWHSITNTASFDFPYADECFDRVTRWCKVD